MPQMSISRPYVVEPSNTSGGCNMATGESTSPKIQQLCQFMKDRRCQHYRCIASHRVTDPVPERDNFVRKLLDRNTESTREAEIRQFQFTIHIDQQILWLQVAMQHSVFVCTNARGQWKRVRERHWHCCQLQIIELKQRFTSVGFAFGCISISCCCCC